MLKMIPYGLSKGPTVNTNIFNSIKKLEIIKFLFKFRGPPPKSKANTVHVFILMLFLNQQRGLKVEEDTWKQNSLL